MERTIRAGMSWVLQERPLHARPRCFFHALDGNPPARKAGLARRVLTHARAAAMN